VAAVTTHIEPMGEMIEVAPNLNDTTANRMTARARRVAAAICGPDACHAFRLWPEADALALSMHCTLPPAMSIVEAHTISESLKDALRQELPQLKRVMVHVEPPT
jgi:divalent metal cation (Fe/Co/Zn/Cd) transporter